MSGGVMFVKSQRGGDKLVHEGFLYNKSHKDENYWRCELQDGKKGLKVCPGKVIFREKSGVEIRGEHNHPPDLARVETLKIKSKMKALAKSLDETADLSEIFAKATANSSPDIVNTLSKEVLEKSIRRIRRYERTRELRKNKTPKKVTVHKPENDLTAEQSSAILEKIQLNTEVPSYLQSQKGRKKLTWRGYLYNRDRKEGGKSFWKCEKTKVCHSRCTFSGGKVVVTCAHTHKPDIANLHKLAVRAKIRSEALSLESQTTPATIAANLRHQVPDDLAKVVSKDNIRHALSYYRKKLSNNPNPSSVFKVESDSEEEQKISPLQLKKSKLESKMSPIIAPVEQPNLEQSVVEIPQPEENKENSVIKNVALKKRIQKDFKPMLRDLRKTMIQQVGQMMADFEQNFFDYLVSVTEDSAGLLKEMNTVNDSDEEDDDCEDGDSTMESDVEDEEEEEDDDEMEDEDDEAEEDGADIGEQIEGDKSSNDNEDDSDEENHYNPNKSLDTSKTRGKKRSSAPSPKPKSTSGQKKVIKRKSRDEDDDDDVDYSSPVKASGNSREYGLRSKSVSFVEKHSTPPSKKRKTRTTPARITPARSTSSKRKGIEDPTESSADSDSSKLIGNNTNDPSSILPEDEIKVENESENEETESGLLTASTLMPSGDSELSTTMGSVHNATADSFNQSTVNSNATSDSLV